MNVRRLFISFAILCFSLILTMPVFANNSETGTVDEALKQAAEEKEEQPNEESQNEEVVANDEEQQEQLNFAETPSLLSLFVRLILALAFIIAIIYFLLRFVNKRTRSFSTHQTLQNIGGVPLGTNRSIQIVKVGNRLLVVGVGDSIQLLKEIDNKEEIDLILSETDTNIERLETPITKTFDKLTQMFSRNPNAQNVTQNNNLEFRELLDKQMKDVSKSQRKIHEAMKEHSDE